MNSSKHNARRVLAESLKGKVLNIPDLHALFQGWPEDVNVQVDVLRQDVDERLNRYLQYCKITKHPVLS